MKIRSVLSGIFYLIVLFVGMASLGIGQNVHYKDSILNVLEQQYDAQKKHINDTVFLNLLNELTFEYIFLNPDSAIFYGNITIKLAQKPEHFRYKANAYMYMALAYNEMQKLTEALQAHDLALQLFLENHDSISYAKALVNKSNTLKYLKNYASSLEALITAKEIAKRYGLEFFYSQCNTNLGNLYLQIDDIEKAEQYILEAYEYYKARGIKKGLILVIPNLASIYFKKGQKLISAKFAEEYVRLAEELNEPYYIIYSLNDLSLYYLRIGKPLSKILPKIEKAISLSEKLTNAKLRLDLRLSKAEILLQHSKTNEAFAELSFIKQNLLYEGDVSLLRSFYKMYAEALHKLRRFEEAVEALEIYHQYDKEIKELKHNDELHTLKLQQLITESQLLKKEAETKQEKWKLDSSINQLLFRRNVILASATVLLLFGSIWIFTLIIKANSLNQRLKLANESLTQEQELFIKGPVIAFRIEDAESLLFSYLSPNVKSLLNKLKCEKPWQALYQLSKNPEQFKIKIKNLALESQNDFVLDECLHYHDEEIRCRMYIKPINKNQKIKSLIGFIVDVDEVHQLNRSLEQMNALLDSTNSIGKVGSWRFDLKKNELMLSKQALQINGIDENEKLDVTSATQLLKEGESKDRLLQKFSMLNPENSRIEEEFEIVTPAGEEKAIWILAQGRFENGKLAYVEGIEMDISEQKKQQKELELALNFTAEQNKRLRNFTHIVSHNLRSHSANFEVILNLLKEADAHDKELINAIETNTYRLKETLQHLSEVIKVQNSQNILFTEIKVKQEILKIIDTVMMSKNKENASISVNFDESLNIHYVPAYFQSVMYNLISNAVKYKHPERQAIIQIYYDENDHFHIIKVQDNGLGIDLKRHGDRLFGMYKTFHKNEDARGIGLFLTKNQLEFTGGKIEVESEPGHGSIFTVYIKKLNTSVLNNS